MNKFNDLDLEYRLSPRRKSIGIQVTIDGRVVVAVPRGAKRADLARALERHRGWIETKVAERQAAWSRIPKGTAFFLGQPYPIRAERGDRTAVSLTENALRVSLPPSAELWPLLQVWYREQALRLLQERADHFGPLMGPAPGPVALREWKRRWGECRPDGALRFNWRLIMCPPAVIDYVVVHELAHLKVSGHNPSFWALVAEVLPDYAHRRRWLNQTGAPFLLWQP